MKSEEPSFFINSTKNSAVLQCYCGYPEAGRIIFDISEGTEDAKEWWLRWMIYCSFNFNAGNGFKNRIKHAWKVLTGQDIWGQAKFSAKSCREFAEWLKSSVDKLESIKTEEDNI